ncbi:MAG: Trigger factor [Parcubacteria group bacterium GW2011_GWA2_47_16]|nr:MAG: Trigger factor [Parcubacteria group bacterium GW2011_GWA2_47_16]
MKPYTLIGEKNLPESELEIEVEISYETLATHRAAAIKKIAPSVSVAGFRIGHVPENILVQKVGEMAILEEAAHNAVEKTLSEILGEKKISILGEPRVSITKLAAGNPLAFKITVSVLPEVKLPDYKKIAATENTKKPEEISVSEKEVTDFIENIRKGYAHSTAPTPEGVGVPTSDVGKSVGENLPELSDEFVKKLGDFKDVADFKVKIAENLRHEKTQKAREKKRLSLAEAVLNKTDVAVPKALIESELAKLLARFHDDITRMGMKMEDYLKHIKKSEEDMRKEWRPDAEKRGKLQMVFDTIAITEKIEAPKEAVELEVKHLLEHYKDAEPSRTRAYVTMMMTNEKVFEFLESQK